MSRHFRQLQLDAWKPLQGLCRAFDSQGCNQVLQLVRQWSN